MTTPSSSTESIERTVHTSASVLIYGVPPLTAYSKGYVASQWTTRPPMFTARLRIIETATSAQSADLHSPDKVTASIRLEDPGTSELFAAAPYTHPTVVTPCVDSARFFAVRVQGDGGMKATLGIGFEERTEAFDFKAALADVGRVLGFGMSGPGGRGRAPESSKPRDLSLKEGEMVTVSVAGMGTRDASHGAEREVRKGSDVTLFAIKPPPPPAPSVNPRAALDAVRIEDEDDDGFGDFQ